MNKKLVRFIDIFEIQALHEKQFKTTTRRKEITVRYITPNMDHYPIPGSNRWTYFSFSEHGEESLKVFIDQVNMFHPTKKCIAEYSKEEVNFLDLNIKLINGELKTDLLS